MKSRRAEVCWDCGKEMERCKAASVAQDGVVKWVCRRCWKELDYDSYLYGARVNEERKEGL